MKDESKTKAMLIAELNDLRRQQEAPPQESKAEYRRLVDDLPVGVATLAADGAVISHNACLCRMLGYTPDELHGLPVSELCASSENRAEVLRALESRGVSECECAARRRDGRIVWLRLHVRAIKDDSGEVRHYQMILEDISQQQRRDLAAAAFQRLRRAIWDMRSVDDIEAVMDATKAGLKSLGVPFVGLGVNVVEQEHAPQRMRHFECQTPADPGCWRFSEDDPGNELVMRCLRAGRPLYRRDVLAEDVYREGRGLEMRFGAVRSVVDVPFRRGTLAVNSTRAEAFSAADIAFLEELADVLSEGFRRLEDLRVMELRAREAEALASAISAVGGTGGVKEVLQIVVQAAAELMTCSLASLFLYDEEDGVLVPQAQLGHDWEVFRRIRLQPGEASSGHVFSTGESMLTPADEDFSAYPLRPCTRSLYDEATGGRGRSGLGGTIALRMNGRIIGTLAVADSSRWLDAHDLEMLEHLGAQAVVAIDRVRRIQALEAEVVERRQMEEALRESEERFKLLVEKAPLGVALISSAGRYLYVNPAFEEMFGYTLADIPTGAAWFARAFPDPGLRAEVRATWISDLKTHGIGETRPRTFDVRCADGTTKTVHFRPVSMEDGQQLLVCEDTTERKRLETEMIRAHNLESLGVLAGGIAHDFNNMLTGVLGNLGLLEMMLDEAGDLRPLAADARSAAERTRELTQQLMTFSKGGSPIKEPASIEELIRDTTVLSLHGSNTRPEFHFAEALAPVDIDKGQIAQVVQNLVINADQAMVDGGMLRISAENVTISSREISALAPGRYVKVVVADQGTGMSPEVMRQIFDPYFSTKQMGHGLGLSIVFSIIQRHGGHTTVESEIGVGTTFAFYLPVATRSAASADARDEELPTGVGRVLLMDDDETARRTVERMLATLGYQVHSVADGTEALAAYAARMDSGSSFDLVIMDLTIPGGMGGREAVGRLHELDPHARVLVSSGHAHDPVMARWAEFGFCGCILKPVGVHALAAAVQRAMDPPRSGE